MRLSKRMVQVLELLDNQCHEYTDEEKLELKKQLQQFQFGLAKIGAMFGKNVEREKLEVTDKDVVEEIRLRNSISLKFIIMKCEGLLETYKQFFERDTLGNAVKRDKENYAEPHYNPSYHSWFSFRFHVSLVEALAGKLFPKGRSWKSQALCKHFEGYEEAFKKAKSLQASYSRAMTNLVGKRLVEKFNNGSEKERRYIITDYGSYLLAFLTKDRVANT